MRYNHLNKAHLQARRLAQIDSMSNVLAEHVGCHQVIHIAGLPSMRPERECVHPACLAELVEGVQVGIDVECVVAEHGQMGNECV